ncbi:MAG: MerC domain-containing protein [Pseudomonadota bacterium]
MNESTSASAARGAAAPFFDLSAAGLSGLCLLHCLALPLLATTLPLAGVLAEAEWIHKALVLAALPLSVYAVLRTGLHLGDTLFVLLVASGFALLVASAFVEEFERFEQLMTAFGAGMVASGHLWRLYRHSATTVQRR